MKPKQCKPVFLLALVICMPNAQARIAGTPFSLSLSQTFTHDSNFERVENGVADTASSTAVRLQLDKELGRQSYTADVTANANKFQTLDQYDNNGVDINLGFSSELGASSKISLNHARVRQLQDFDVQETGDPRKNVTTNTNTVITVQHGLNKQWSLLGSLDIGDIDYTATPEDIRSSKGRKFSIRFSPSDLLYFETGINFADFVYPNASIFSSGVNITGDDIDRTDLTFQTNWVLTGFSRLFAQLNWTREKHAISGTGRDYDGLTGVVSWRFTPRGKVDYSLQISHNTNNSGGSNSADRSSARDSISTDLNGSAVWRISPKFNMNTRFSLQQLKEYEKQTYRTEESQELVSSTLKQWRLGATYAMSDSLSLSCGFTHLRRTASLFRAGYLSKASDCLATFSME